MRFKYLARSLSCLGFAALVGCSGGGNSSGGLGSNSTIRTTGVEDEGLSAEAVMSVADTLVGDDAAVPASAIEPGDDEPVATAAEDDSANAQVEDPFADALAPAPTFVAPQTAVDCADRLPCRWLSESGSFGVTVTRADNTATGNRLAVLYRVDVLHDTSVLLGNSMDAQDTSGQRFKPVQKNLAESTGAAPVEMLAGDSADGSIIYDMTATDGSLSYLNLAVIDNDLPYSVEFSALPTGPANSETADCANTLPCTWTSANADTSVTLLAAGGYDVDNRLSVNFQVNSTVDDTVVLEAGSVAVGNDGTPVKALRHRLGNEHGIDAISHPTFAGAALPGNVSFYRTANRPASLAQLELAFHRDSPEPLWNPRFSAIPLQ